MVRLTRDFMEKRTTTLLKVPREWDVQAGHFYYYQLGLRMCQIRFLRYEFQWGDERQPVPRATSILEQPSRILTLDISLNDLIALEQTGLAPFKQLRVLDASLNRIDNITGLEVLKYLYLVNLSHNKIQDVRALRHCQRLTDLNMGMNEIQEIAHMPPLTILRVIHLNNNKLQSLEGIQTLSGLQELYVQRNQLSDLLPLSSSLRLTVLNAADNDIGSLNTTVDILKGLRHLRIACLYGNPIDRESNYMTRLSKELSLRHLDNITLLPRFTTEDQPSEGPISDLKDVARAAFADHLKTVKVKMEENVRFLQNRIITLQKEYNEYEARMQHDLEACLQYLNHIPADQATRFNYDFLNERLNTPGPHPWHQSSSPGKQRSPIRTRALNGTNRDTPFAVAINQSRPDYSTVKETDDVLRCAYNELVRQDVALQPPS